MLSRRAQMELVRLDVCLNAVGLGKFRRAAYSLLTSTDGTPLSL